MQPNGDLQQVRKAWYAVGGKLAEKTRVLRLTDGWLGVTCRSQEAVESVNQASSRLAAEVNERLRTHNTLVGVHAVVASETEDLLAAVLEDALDRIEKLSEQLAAAVQ